MWIGEVDFPSELIDAHVAGRLVIFVGAGASLASPSDLPDFGGLTRDVIASSMRILSEEQEKLPLESKLGILEHDGINVNALVAGQIGNTLSRPNRLHDAIARLACGAPTARIVTTNYDRHLSTAIATIGQSIGEYAAPALPVGSDFEGVVYLHGRVDGDPKHLVVTDKAFGRAYLTDAWAARFVERMFSTYTVLFIGYSHNDVVMTYLARGLTTPADRFVLSADPHNPRWNALGIHAVGYPNVDRSHGALGEAVSEWADRASMSLLDHRARIAELVAGPPPLLPAEISYLESVVADPTKAGLFIQFARGAEWLAWIANQPPFAELLNSSDPLNGSRVLAWWFAAHYVIDEQMSAVALEVVRKAGGGVGPVLWNAIGQALHTARPPNKPWRAPWLTVLVANDPGHGSYWLEYALHVSTAAEDQTSAFILFNHLLAPIPKPGRVRLDVRLRGEADELRSAWEQVFQPKLATSARDLLDMSVHNLVLAHRLVDNINAGHGTASLSFGRPAVEPHEQNRSHNDIDFLVDIVRDCLSTLLAHRDPYAEYMLVRWASSEYPLIRRLAVHGWSLRCDVDNTAKVQAILDNDWLNDFHLHHEVFHLVEVALPGAARHVALEMVDSVLAGPTDVEDQPRRAFEQYRMLEWMTTTDPSLTRVIDERDKLISAYPELAKVPRVDFTSYLTGGWVGPRYPMSPEELHDRIAGSTAAAIEDLEQYKNAAYSFHEPSWSDAVFRVKLLRQISSREGLVWVVVGRARAGGASRWPRGVGRCCRR